MVFVLPAGTGTAAVNLFSSNGCLASPKLLTYAAPQVQQVHGCADSGNTTSSCPQDGGTQLSVEGSSFGPSGALVLVGGKACVGVTHDASTPHRKLTCALPAGTGKDVPVVVIAGQVASNAGTLSYAP
ncbi:MAG: IPT/TIG domain-containing protein [Myxococcales bacterium]